MMILLAGLDPSDEDLLMHLDHDGWKETGVDSGITRARLLVYAKQKERERREHRRREPVGQAGKPLALVSSTKGGYLEQASKESLLSSVKGGFLDKASKQSSKAADKASANAAGAAAPAAAPSATEPMAELVLGERLPHTTYHLRPKP